MKKLTVLTILSSALLASGAAQADWRGNWLLGASGAYNWYHGSFAHGVDFDLPGADSPPFIFHNDLNSQGWSWGLLGGYQIKCNRLLLGAEVNVDWYQRHQSENYANTLLFNGDGIGTSVSATFKRDATWGLTARLGYEVRPCLIAYLRAGIERRHDEFDVIGGAAIPGAPAEFTFEMDDTKHSYRFIGGIGAEAPIPMLKGLTLRTEYNYRPNGKTIQSSTNWNLAGVAEPIFSTVSDAKQHINTVKASIVYNFTI